MDLDLLRLIEAYLTRQRWQKENYPNKEKHYENNNFIRQNCMRTTN